MLRKTNILLEFDAAVQTAVKLRGVLPVVVDADVWEDTGEALDDIFIPDAEIWCVQLPICISMVVQIIDCSYAHVGSTAESPLCVYASCSNTYLAMVCIVNLAAHQVCT